MDRLDMYKIRIRNDKSNQQQRRCVSNQYRSINRANEYLNRRQIEVSPSPLLSSLSSKNPSNGQIISNSSPTKGKAPLKSKNIYTKSIIKEKKLSYKERFKIWKQEKIQKENLQQKKKNQIKSFVSTVHQDNGIFNLFSNLANEKNKIQFKKPLLPPTPSVGATNGIKSKDKKLLKNRQNNILNPSNGNGIRQNENKFKEKLNIVNKVNNAEIKLLDIPKLNQSYVTSTAKKSQQLSSLTTSTSLTLSTSVIVSTVESAQSNEKPNNDIFIKKDEEVINSVEKSLENLCNLNGNDKYEGSEKSKDFAKHCKINLQNESLLQKFKILNDDHKEKNDVNDKNECVELKKWADKNRRPLTKTMKKRKEDKIFKEKLKSTDFMKFMRKVEVDFRNECLKKRDNDKNNKYAQTEEDPILTSLHYSVRLLDKKSLKDKLQQKQNELTSRRLSTPKQIRMQKIVKRQEQNIICSSGKSPKQKEKANSNNNNNEGNKMDDGSKISLQTVYKTPTKSASSTNDYNERPPNYVSPYVGLYRGKVSLKKEIDKRNSLCKTDYVASSSPVICDSIKIRHIKEAIKYFRNLLTSEMQRLNELCNKWGSYQNNKNLQNDHNNDTKQMLIHEDNCNDMINVTIGQTKLLLNKKLKQFNDLIDKCEKYTIPKIKFEELKVSGKHGNDENMKANKTKISENFDDNENIKLILPEDLEGFWSMVYLQVENIDKKFLNLDRWKENDWKDPDEIKVMSNTKPNTKRKQIQQKKNKTAGNGVSKEIQNMLKAYKQKFKFNKKSNDDVIFISNHHKNVNEDQKIKLYQNQRECKYEQIINNNEDENHESTAIQKIDVLPLTPLRRSVRLMNKSSNNSSIQKSTKQARIKKIIERNSRSRSNTPQKNMSPLCHSAIPRSIIKPNSKLTDKKLKLLYNDDEIAYTPNNTSNRKSILKPPNSNVKGSVKRCVVFANAEHIKMYDINNEIRGINSLNKSANNNEYAFLAH